MNWFKNLINDIWLWITEKLDTVTQKIGAFVKEIFESIFIKE